MSRRAGVPSDPWVQRSGVPRVSVCCYVAKGLEEGHLHSPGSAFDLRLLDSGEGVPAGLAASPLGPWSPRPRRESQEQGRLGGKSLENPSHGVQVPSAFSAPSSCRKKGWTVSRSLQVDRGPQTCLTKHLRRSAA